MTFGAMTAWQALLLLGAAAAVAAGLFLIKLRPPRMTVPSLMLWRRVLDESRELTLWERIRRAVSLVLTVIIALALALAMTRPGRSAGTAASSGRVLIVIDSSWSMQARTGTGETRWERAIAEARRLVSAAAGGEVALATTADGLVEGPSTDGTLVDGALDRIAPGGDASSWPQLAGVAEIHFITDGGTARPLDAKVIVHSVFEPAANAGITALDVRPSLSSANAGDAYVEIANFAPSAEKVRLTLTRGTARIFDRELDMGRDDVLRQVVPLPRGDAAALRAHVDSPANALDIDDDAYAWIEGAQPLSVAVVGQRTDWLRTAFARDPGVRATFYDPTGYVDGPEDVAIFVGYAPIRQPRRPALFFAPPLTTEWLGPRRDDAMENRPRWEVAGVHPVVQGVDPFTLSIDRARAFGAPSLVPVARSARGTPLVYVSESPEQRLVVVTFGADESNLAGAPGFPVLIGNALDWLTHPSPGLGPAGVGHRPRLMSFEAGVAKVTGPDGVDVPLARVNRTTVGMLRTPGFYTVEGGGARNTIAINAGDPQISNLMRPPSLGNSRSRTVAAGSSSLPWWFYCALAAFALAIAEWWTWQRRITV